MVIKIKVNGGADLFEIRSGYTINYTGSTSATILPIPMSGEVWGYNMLTVTETFQFSGDVYPSGHSSPYATRLAIKTALQTVQPNAITQLEMTDTSGLWDFAGGASDGIIVETLAIDDVPNNPNGLHFNMKISVYTIGV